MNWVCSVVLHLLRKELMCLELFVSQELKACHSWYFLSHTLLRVTGRPQQWLFYLRQSWASATMAGVELLGRKTWRRSFKQPTETAGKTIQAWSMCTMPIMRPGLFLEGRLKRKVLEEKLVWRQEFLLPLTLHPGLDTSSLAHCYPGWPPLDCKFPRLGHLGED